LNPTLTQTEKENILSKMRFKPGSLGQTMATLANFPMPKYVICIKIYQIVQSKGVLLKIHVTKLEQTLVVKNFLTHRAWTTLVEP
jgi:hypothetical protein